MEERAHAEAATASTVLTPPDTTAPLNMFLEIYSRRLKKSFLALLIRLCAYHTALGALYSMEHCQMTKCGRFGPKDFDYRPSRIRQCVLESLERLQTSYLDAVYLHDVEFVATSALPKLEGNHVSALRDEAGAYGLAKGDEAKIRGPGDQVILDALAELRKLKEEGTVRNIGITGTERVTRLRTGMLIRSRRLSSSDSSEAGHSGQQHPAF
jgi:hypothetical protein